MDLVTGEAAHLVHVVEERRVLGDVRVGAPQEPAPLPAAEAVAVPEPPESPAVPAPAEPAAEAAVAGH